MTAWPSGRDFAFTIFDDADSQTLENGRPVYDLLGELGFRTRSRSGPSAARACPRTAARRATSRTTSAGSKICKPPGFEIGFHMATSHTSRRDETIAALDDSRSTSGARR
jgi:hypothetical protein